MEEKALVDELLKKAVEKGVISEVQKRFYELRYNKGEISFQKLQDEISQAPSTKQYHKQLWPYKFIRSLGRGGMGEVYEACHRETGQKVAIKKIRFYVLQDEEAQENARKRFLRECCLQAKLIHPNIVRVYDFGAYGTELFLVTQLIEGETLIKIVQQQKKACGNNYFRNVAPVLVEKMQKICDAIDYAHKNGIIHRDINPRNIMIDKNDEIVIMDFGLAKKIGPDTAKLTKSNELLGTPSYMSPEQWNGGEVGTFSDVYSLGATLYFVITGELPQPQEPTLAFHNIANRIPPNPIQIYSPEFPESLSRLVFKALDYDPKNRFTSAGALKDAISGALEDWKKSQSSLFSRIRTFWKM